MGFGASPFGGSPYGSGAPPAPADPITTAVSCRAIDGVTRDYVTDENGNAAGMDGTANRVYLLLSYSDARSKIITAQGIAARQAAIRRALEPLTRGAEPAIRNLTVDIVDTGTDRIEGTVTYYNLLTQKLETVNL